MRDAYGPRKLKWALDWPLTIPRSPSVNVHLMSIFVVLGGTMVLVLAVATLHTRFGSG
jgi:hypothetical protein